MAVIASFILERYTCTASLKIKEIVSVHKQKPLRNTRGNNSHRIDP